MNGLTVSLALAVGALLGALAHAKVTKGQNVWSRETAGTCIVSVLIGVLYPLYPIIPLPESANVVQKAAIMFGIAYVAGDAVTNLLPNVFSRLLPK